MKTIRFIALVVICVFAATSVSAYVGECPVGMTPESCCSTEDHCSSDPTFEHTIASAPTDITNVRTGICQLVLSELWRDAAVKVEDDAQMALLPPSRPVSLKTRLFHNPTPQQPTFRNSFDHLRSVILLL
jgi:hypothetical protein